MKYLSALVLLFALAGFAQSAPAPGAPMAPVASSAATAPKVTPQDVVISVDGICRGPIAKGGECRTAITRAEFERLMDVLSRQRTGQAWRSVPPQAKIQLAQMYSRLLVAANAADKLGLEHTPEAQELIRFSRLEALSEELSRDLTKKAQVTPEEIRKYYDGNPERFVEVTLQRILVARSEGDGEAAKKLTSDLRVRAAAGGDFQALQAEASKASGQSSEVAVKLVLLKDALSPSAQAAVSRLKPGEVSPVIEDAGSFSIYKLDATRQVPFEQKQAEIQSFLAGQMAQREIEKLIGSAKPKLNPEYFEQQGSSTVSVALPAGPPSAHGERK